MATLTVTLAVLAPPGAAKAPVFPPVGCPQGEVSAWAPVKAACERGSAAKQTTGDRNGSGMSDGAILAGSLAIVVLTIAGGLLVATHRRDAQGSHATALSGSRSELSA